MQISFCPYHPSAILRNHLKMGSSRADGNSITVNSRFLEFNQKPVLPVMGEYHFSRDSRANWPRELAKMKAGGITIVSTYLFWLYHEEIEGQFDFSGDLDVRAFVTACREQDLSVILRIGPWVHGECRNGGFPDWLVQSELPLRTNDPRYLKKAAIWYEQIFKQVQGLFFKDGGPIIGIQFENELTDNAAHLLTLKRMALAIGYEAPLYTVTGWNSKYGARIPVDEVLPVFAAYVDAPWAETRQALPPSPHFAFDPARNDAAVGMDVIEGSGPDGWQLPYDRYPFATCELGCGLQATHHRRPIVSAMDAYALSLVKLGCGNNLIGYYMYHGGTNKIGRLSTFQESRATGYPNDYPILNYDFQTCLSQYGEAREPYGLLNLLHLFAADFGDRLAPMESVSADPFVPCTDRTHLRCCMRTDGQSGFVFVNHHQRSVCLEPVCNVQIHALDVDFPPIDVTGDQAFFLPFHMNLDHVHLRFATAQPVCRYENTFFFAAADGIVPQYQFVSADGTKKERTAKPGFDSAFDVDGVRIVTLTRKQAQYLRRLDGKIYIGDSCNLYLFDGTVCAIEDGGFSFRHYTGEGFRTITCRREFTPAVLTAAPCAEPFVPPYEEELILSRPRGRRWKKLCVSSPDGFVTIHETYDAAQIYTDGYLAADNFWTGVPWRVPASLLYGKTCYLVLSEQFSDFYSEADMF